VGKRQKKGWLSDYERMKKRHKRALCRFKVDRRVSWLLEMSLVSFLCLTISRKHRLIGIHLPIGSGWFIGRVARRPGNRKSEDGRRGAGTGTTESGNWREGKSKEKGKGRRHWAFCRLYNQAVKIHDTHDNLVDVPMFPCSHDLSGRVAGCRGCFLHGALGRED
jgi:hypothetical protein